MTNREQLRLRVLEIAQQLLHNEYVDRKAQLHNEWSVTAEVVWKTAGRKPPYPSFPPYPTSDQLIMQAETLLAFVFGPDLGVDEPKSEHAQPLDNLDDVEPREEPVLLLEDVVAEVPQDPVLFEPVESQREDLWPDATPTRVVDVPDSEPRKSLLGNWLLKK